MNVSPDDARVASPAAAAAPTDAAPTDAARPLTLSDFDFQLPPELIAQHPAAERSASRLLDGRRVLGDQLGRQLEVEVGQHERPARRGGRGIGGSGGGGRRGAGVVRGDVHGVQAGPA